MGIVFIVLSVCAILIVISNREYIKKANLKAKMSNQISLGEEIEKLATLRKQGVISDSEFQAFSERFKLATGEKASSIIKAISELCEQHQKGAILEGNYQAALWSLLDKLDRKI